MQSLSGRTIGQHIVKEKLGSGGMAEVYKALHPRLNAYRAIKIIRPEFSGSEDFRARFIAEAQLVAGLRHPNIVQVHDFGDEDGLYYMVMEYVEGQDLHSMHKAGRIDLTQAVDLILQVSRGLQEAHGQGVLHRDLKPENVMVNTKGQAILMDFGIARLLDADTRLTQTGMSIGTPQYMAPEQLLGEREVTAAADVYALGVMLYELLVGEQPFRANTPAAAMVKSINDPLPLPRASNPAIPEALENVILRACAKDPQQRFADAAALAAALQAVPLEASTGSDRTDTPTIVMPKDTPAQSNQREHTTSPSNLPWQLIALGQLPLLLIAAQMLGLFSTIGTISIVTHLLAITPLLVYLGVAGKGASKQAPFWLSSALLRALLALIALATLMSHAYFLQMLALETDSTLIYSLAGLPQLGHLALYVYAVATAWPLRPWWARSIAIVQILPLLYILRLYF